VGAGVRPAFRFRPRGGVEGPPSADLIKHREGPSLTLKGAIYSYWISRRIFEERGRSGLFLPPLPLYDKSVAYLILSTEAPCLPACISYKCPILINLFLAYHCLLLNSFCAEAQKT